MASASGHTVTGLTVGAAYTGLVLVWRDAGAPVVAATADSVTFGPSVTAINQWVESRVTFAASATSQVVGIARMDTGVGRAYVGAVAVVPAPSLDEPYTGPYFDGSVTDQDRTNTWDGAPNASTSTSTYVGPLWQLSDGAPSAEVFFPTLATGTETIDVDRYADNRRMPVRGGAGVYAVDGASIIDPEPGFRIPVTYRAEMFDAAGVSLGFTDGASLYIDESRTWITQPLNPELGVAVIVREKAAGQLVRPIPGEMVYPEGSAVGHWIGGTRLGLQKVNLDVHTETFEQAAMMQAIWGTYEIDQLPVVCVRTPPPIRLPRTLFVAIPEPAEVARNVHAGFENIDWLLVGDEAAPPAPGLVVPFLTYDDLDAAYVSYDERDAAYATYLDQDRDYSLAGLAS